MCVKTLNDSYFQTDGVNESVALFSTLIHKVVKHNKAHTFMSYLYYGDFEHINSFSLIIYYILFFV